MTISQSRYPVPYDYTKLIDLIGNKRYSYERLAKDIGMSGWALRAKLKRKYAFDQPEIDKLCQVLEIPTSKIPYYFFNL